VLVVVVDVEWHATPLGPWSVRWSWSCSCSNRSNLEARHCALQLVRSHPDWFLVTVSPTSSLSIAPTGQARRGPTRGRGKVFPGPRLLGAPQSLKDTENWVPDGFFLTSNMHKSIFDWGSARTPLGELAYNALLDLYSGMVRGHPSHVSSISARTN